MKYFIDLEFIEGKQCSRKWPFFKTPPTIDAISIAIVAEDGRELYLVSKEFNFAEAWNRYDLIDNKQYPAGPENIKNYWLRDNVLQPLHTDLIVHFHQKRISEIEDFFPYQLDKAPVFTKDNLKWMINKYGFTRKEMASKIYKFCTANGTSPEFYGYYADYDWVVFCWLFGRMIDLPPNFPMYCNDINQYMNDVAKDIVKKRNDSLRYPEENNTVEHWIKQLRADGNFPKEPKVHSALLDARYHRDMYFFLAERFPNIIPRPEK